MNLIKSAIPPPPSPPISHNSTIYDVRSRFSIPRKITVLDPFSFSFFHVSLITVDGKVNSRAERNEAVAPFNEPNSLLPSVGNRNDVRFQPLPVNRFEVRSMDGLIVEA